MHKTTKILGITGSIGYSVWTALFTYIFIKSIIWNTSTVKTTKKGLALDYFSDMGLGNLILAALMIIFSLLAIISCVFLFIIIFGKKPFNVSRAKTIIFLISFILGNILFVLIPSQSYIVSLYYVLMVSNLLDFPFNMQWIKYISIALIAINFIFNIYCQSKKESESI